MTNKKRPITMTAYFDEPTLRKLNEFRGQIIALTGKSFSLQDALEALIDLGAERAMQALKGGRIKPQAFIERYYSKEKADAPVKAEAQPKAKKKRRPVQPTRETPLSKSEQHEKEKAGTT